jgi:UTP--glucose-1-phosphate uridylyltransferase
VLDVKPAAAPKLSSVVNIIEKPAPEEAPSELVVTGRYLLTPRIFKDLEETGRGHHGEIQLTDALNLLAAREGLDALEYDGVTLDTGEPQGWLAANLHFSE